MILLAILIVLALYQFTDFHHRFENSRWFETLIEKSEAPLQRLFPAENMRFLFLLLMPLLVLWVLVHLVKFTTGSMGQLIIDTLVLWYALLYREPISIIPGTTRDQTRFLFVDALSQGFSVIFWFVLVGPLGALLYDFARRAKQTRYATFAQHTCALLDWPSARLLGFGYALAGHFSPSFSYWVHHIFSDAQQNHLFLEENGLYALNGNITDMPKDESEPAHAKALVKRAEIMLLSALAIFTLGYFLY